MVVEGDRYRSCVLSLQPVMSTGRRRVTRRTMRTFSRDSSWSRRPPPLRQRLPPVTCSHWRCFDISGQTEPCEIMLVCVKFKSTFWGDQLGWNEKQRCHFWKYFNGSNEILTLFWELSTSTVIPQDTSVIYSMTMLLTQRIDASKHISPLKWMEVPIIRSRLATKKETTSGVPILATWGQYNTVTQIGHSLFQWLNNQK